MDRLSRCIGRNPHPHQRRTVSVAGTRLRLLLSHALAVACSFVCHPVRDLLLLLPLLLSLPSLSHTTKCHFDRSCSRLCEQRSGEIRFSPKPSPSQHRALAVACFSSIPKMTKFRICSRCGEIFDRLPMLAFSPRNWF